MVAGAGGCASVDYRVPTWEVQRLAELSPAERGNEIRVIPANAAVPAPAATPVVEAEPPDVDVDVDLDVDVPVVAAPRPVVAPQRPAVRARPVGATGLGGSWRPAPPVRPGITRPAPVSGRGGATTHVRSGSGGGHSSGGGGAGAGAAAGAIVAVALIALVAEAAATASAADAARVYDGWVNVDPGHPVHLFYGRNVTKVVPLAQLGSWDLVGLEYAILEEYDGHIEPVRRAPTPGAASPPARMPTPPPPVATQPFSPPSPQTTGEIIAVRPAPVGWQTSAPVAPAPPSLAPPPAPARQATDSDSP